MVPKPALVPKRTSKSRLLTVLKFSQRLYCSTELTCRIKKKIKKKKKHLDVNECLSRWWQSCGNNFKHNPLTLHTLPTYSLLRDLGIHLILLFLK